MLVIDEHRYASNCILRPSDGVLQHVAVGCRVLQGVAECCRVLQCVALYCSVLQHVVDTLRACSSSMTIGTLATAFFVSLMMCCSVLQCVAVCCSVLQCVAVYHSVLQHVAVTSRACSSSMSTGKLATAFSVPLMVRCSVLQCVAVCCSVLQCVAACCSVTARCSHPPHLSSMNTGMLATLSFVPLMVCCMLQRIAVRCSVC